MVMNCCDIPQILRSDKNMLHIYLIIYTRNRKLSSWDLRVATRLFYICIYVPGFPGRFLFLLVLVGSEKWTWDWRGEKVMGSWIIGLVSEETLLASSEIDLCEKDKIGGNMLMFSIIWFWSLAIYQRDKRRIKRGRERQIDRVLYLM
jgi:hypothetical protein